jgi:hypothetical protein
MKVDRLRAHNLANGIDVPRFADARAKAVTNVDKKSALISEQEGAAEALRQAWIDRQHEFRTASRGADIILPPPPPEPLPPPGAPSTGFSGPPNSAPSQLAPNGPIQESLPPAPPVNEGPSSGSSLPENNTRF